MGSIFDINAEFQSLYEMATDPDCDEQVFNDTLEALTGELSIKAAGYVAVINQLKMESKQADEVSKAFAEKKRVRDNHIKRMNEVLMFVMDQTGIEKLEAGDYTIKQQKNGGVQLLKIDGEVPESFTKVTVEPDNDKIREFLKDNECEWAHLEPRGKHIVIK